MYPKSLLLLSDGGRIRTQGSDAHTYSFHPFAIESQTRKGSLLAERSRRPSQRKSHLRCSLKDGTGMWLDVSVLSVLPTRSVLFPAIPRTDHGKQGIEVD